MLFLLCSPLLLAQSIDDGLSQKRMRKDLGIFKSIRSRANSGLYKYRTPQEMDSIYRWADKQIDRSSTYRDFYNIICQLTDFEGSLHNDTRFAAPYHQNLGKETNGYFPYPIKWIAGQWIVNFEHGEIPLGAEIITINNETIETVVPELYKYYTTDGVNTTGKRIGLTYNFSKYYRLNYGPKAEFLVHYRPKGSPEIKTRRVRGIGFSEYYHNVEKRYSRPFDEPDYKDWEENEIYDYQKLDQHTGILTVNSFSLGGGKTQKHLRYIGFLDSVFTSIRKDSLKNLIVDVRRNGGGTDPNDLDTYSYLAQRNFQENRQAWISFEKLPYLKYAYTKIPRFLRPFGVGNYNRMFKREFPLEMDGKFYEDDNNGDHRIRHPKENAFQGNIYLLIGPRVASAGSLFAAMVAGNKNTTVIGEEAMGGYYGHNGHTPLGYILPKSKIETFFSVVNLEQDVPEKPGQPYDRGIIPEYTVPQTYEDYLDQRDTQMDFTLDLIKQKALDPR